MTKPHILHLDENHPVLLDGLKNLGFENTLAYTMSVPEVIRIVPNYQGIVIRSRIPLNKIILDSAHNLKFIARVGAGMENIDTEYAKNRNISLLAAPEGNRNAVGEHACGMILCLLNKLHLANQSIINGNWNRHQHRGIELSGKTIGIIGYGNTGKSLARKLHSFDMNVLCHDLKSGLGDPYAKQVSLETIQESSQIISLHVTENPSSRYLINSEFINKMKNPFWLINTSRGSVVKTANLVAGIKSNKILGATLDVLEYESKSFTTIFEDSTKNSDLNYLLESERVLLSPHVAGWTEESHYKLSKIILKKIHQLYS